MTGDDIVAKLAMQSTCLNADQGCGHTYCALILSSRAVLIVPASRRLRVIQQAERVVEKWREGADDWVLRDYVKGLAAALEGEQWK
jgi:hypothetical protein